MSEVFVMAEDLRVLPSSLEPAAIVKVPVLDWLVT